MAKMGGGRNPKGRLFRKKGGGERAPGSSRDCEKKTSSSSSEKEREAEARKLDQEWAGGKRLAEKKRKKRKKRKKKELGGGKSLAGGFIPTSQRKKGEGRKGHVKILPPFPDKKIKKEKYGTWGKSREMEGRISIFKKEKEGDLLYLVA